MKLTNGLDEKQLLDQANRIAELNDRIRRVPDKTERQRINGADLSASTPRTESNNFRILSGAEVNIMRDGSLDIANNVLDKLDIVGADYSF